MSPYIGIYSVPRGILIDFTQYDIYFVLHRGGILTDDTQCDIYFALHGIFRNLRESRGGRQRYPK